MVLGILLRKYDNIKPEIFSGFCFICYYTEILKENTEILKVTPYSWSLRGNEESHKVKTKQLIPFIF